MTKAQETPASRVVSQIPVPADVRALSTLHRVDYADAFRVDVGADLNRTGKEWAQAMLMDAPLRVRVKLVCGWSALGLRLGPAWSPRHVLGWPIRRSGAGYVLLGARSWAGMPAELLLRPEPRGVLFATFVQQGNPAVRALWARVIPAHQSVVGSLLTHAARRAEAGG